MAALPDNRPECFAEVGLLSVTMKTHRVTGHTGTSQSLSRYEIVALAR
jgi:hypothetical protein